MTTRCLIQPTPDPSPVDCVFTLSETAALLKISRAKLYRLVTAGRIHAINIGRARRIAGNEIRRLVQEGLLTDGTFLH